jgi:ribosomal protein L13
MKTRSFIAATVGALAIVASTVSNAAVIIEKKHKVIFAPNRAVAARVIDRGRVIEVVRARNIRFVGQPYMYRGNYVMRCYDRFGRIAFCKVNPRTGAFLGVSVRL